MAQKVNTYIEINGQEIRPFSQISIAQELGSHNTIWLTLPTDALTLTGMNILNQIKEYLGTPITLNFSPDIFSLSIASYEQSSFQGIITDVQLTRHTGGEKNVLITASGPTAHLAGLPNARTFTDKTLQDIVNTVLQDVPGGWETVVDPAFTAAIPYVVQYKENNMHFLQRLAQAYGEWFFFEGTKLIFGKLPRQEAIPLPFDRDLFHFNFTLRIVPLNFNIQSYDYRQDEVYSSTLASASLNDLDTFGQFVRDKESSLYINPPTAVPHQVFLSADELDTLKDHQLRTYSRNMVLASGSSDNPALKLGCITNITGESVRETDHGEFIVTRIHHQINQTGGYSNTFSAIPAEVSSPPVNAVVHRPRCESQRAVVKDNKDPEKLGRVQVQFTWQTDPEMTPWVRIANPYAGQGTDELHGFYFIPEIDDEVLVGFEDDNPDHPIILGNVYNKTSTPAEWYDEDNKLKVIKTRHGNQIHFKDEAGKQEIKIFNDSGATNSITLSMDGSGSISISTKGSLSLSANTISINAKDSITMTSGEETKMNAKNWNVEVAEGSSLKTDTQTMEATNASWTVEANLEVESNQMYTKATEHVTEVTNATLTAESNLTLESTTYSNQSTNASLMADSKIELNGNEVNVTASTALALAGGATSEVKAPNTSIIGDIVAEVKGGTVKLN